MPTLLPQTLSLLPGTYAVAQLPSDSPAPAWAMQGDFWNVTRGTGEISVVTLAGHVPTGVKVDGDWSAYRLHGPFEFTLTGILWSVLTPLADAGIGIFAVSTFDTDYLLVKTRDQARAAQALQAAGHTVAE